MKNISQFEKQTCLGLREAINQIEPAVEHEINMTGIIDILNKNVLYLEPKEFPNQLSPTYEAVRKFVEREEENMKRAACLHAQPAVDSLYGILKASC